MFRGGALDKFCFYLQISDRVELYMSLTKKGDIDITMMFDVRLGILASWAWWMVARGVYLTDPSFLQKSDARESLSCIL